MVPLVDVVLEGRVLITAQLPHQVAVGEPQADLKRAGDAGEVRSLVGLHCRSFKLAAYLQGAAALLLLAMGRWSWLCDRALAWELARVLLATSTLMEAPVAHGRGALRDVSARRSL